MEVDIPNGIGTLILCGCGNSNTVRLSSEEIKAGKSHRCGVDDLCEGCKIFIYKKISELYKEKYSQSHGGTQNG